jgi:WhiB family transcriptional regulator, redox-sensing transcriptional regulator
MYTDWRDYGACRDMDPELFFPRTALGRKYKLVMDTCAVCPVRAQCLEFAVTQQIEYGIYGGVGAGKRAKMIRDRNLGRRDSTLTPRAHGTHGAVRRHQRAGKDLCDECQAFERGRNKGRPRRRTARNQEESAA